MQRFGLDKSLDCAEWAAIDEKLKKWEAYWFRQAAIGLVVLDHGPDWK